MLSSDYSSNSPDSTAIQPSLTVAHVIHSLGAGGAEAVLAELARAAPSVGLRVVVIGISDASSGAETDNRAVAQLREHGATVHEMRAARYDPASVFKLAKLIRDEGADVVHTHLKHADLVGGLAARIAGRPSVSTLHVIEVPTSRLHGIRTRMAVIARRHLATTVIALSEAQSRWYTAYAGSIPSIVLLPNGISRSRAVRSRSAIRAELGVPQDGVMAVCASLMRPEKGHNAMLEAIRRLPEDLPLVVAMAGDGPLLENIRSAVNGDTFLRQRVRVLGFRNDVNDLLHASDFVIQPSLEDALPTALISALSIGRPIVATQVGGIPDIVGPDCGLLVEPGCPAALSAGIAEMVSIVRTRGSALKCMSQAAKERYAHRFSADKWAMDLRRLYERTVRQSRRIALVEFPPSGGLYQFALQLGEGLARTGRTVDLITGPEPELPSRESGCRVRSILPTWHPTAGAQASPVWRRLRRGIRAVQHTAAWAVLITHLLISRPDVVIWSALRFAIDGWGVHIVRRMIPNSVLAIVAHEPRPLVEQPGQNCIYRASRITDRAIKMAYADLDVVFVLGESSRRVLKRTWPIAAPVHVIPHGDEDIFLSKAINGAESTGPVALAFGTITAYKGIDTLFEAWPKVQAEVPHAKLLIAGALSADMDESALRAQVSCLEGVELRTGYIPIQDVASIFAQARCVVLPYKRSSQSGVAHLAHTMGRPVVATRVGDIPAVVQDEISGLLVRPQCPDELATALVRLLTDPATAGVMGVAGRQSLVKSASWDEVATRLDQALPSKGPRSVAVDHGSDSTR